MEEKENVINEEAQKAPEETAKEKKSKQLKKDLEKAEKELAKAQETLSDTQNRYLAVCAEYDNFRKRSAKEKEDCYSAAKTDVVTAFLPLLDNIGRALSFNPDDEGIKALAKQLDEIFEKLGVTEMNTDMQPFDPNFHNAIMHEEDPEVGENIITQTFLKGYMLGDKVIRHAMVKVAN